MSFMPFATALVVTGIGLAGNATIACIGSLFRAPESAPQRAMHLK
jgi:hypothetical protein